MAVALVSLPLVSRDAGAATTRVEAESVAHSGGCWSTLPFSRLSGGAGRSCYAPGSALAWTVAAQNGDVVGLYGYRDSVARGFRIRIDAGPWIEATLSGSEAFSALFFTSPALTAGSHTFELEWANSAGAFTMDYYEVTNSGASTPTTSVAPTTPTTTTAPHTTAVPATTTSPPPAPTTVRTEAESIVHSGTCWAELPFSRFSGGGGRFCHTPEAPLRWTVHAREGDVVRLHGYRDSVSRGFRVRVDGGGWTEGALAGPEDFSALFFTSPALSAGPHMFELEWSPSAGAMSVDFYEISGTGAALSEPPPRTTTTSTTLAATPTTSTSTTTTPTTTTSTTTPPVPGGICRIAPADGQAAITAAIASCPDGSTVQFPTGATYHQSDFIDVADRSNLIIDGGGSTFINSAPNVEALHSNWRLVRVRNVTIRNMVVEGNFKLSGPRSLPTVSSMAANQRNSGFFVYGGRDLTIADVTVRDIFGDLVTIVPSNWTPSGMSPAQLAASEIPTNVRILRLTGTRAARQCIGPTAAYGFWLEDSTLRDCWYGGVNFERDVPGEPQHDMHVLRNTFEGFNLFAIAATYPGNTGDTDGIEIRGNKMLTPGDACIPSIVIGYTPENPNRLLDIVVEDNEIKTLYNGVTFDHVQGGSVQDNRIEKTAPSSLCGPPAGLPLRLTNSTGVAVSGNTAVGYEN